MYLYLVKCETYEIINHKCVPLTLKIKWWFTYLLTYSIKRSPSWGANRCSASHKIPPHFMEPEGSLPHSQKSDTWIYQSISSDPRLFCMNISWGVVSTLSNPRLEDHTLSAVRDYLFNIFAVTLRIWRPFLHPEPEDAQCRGDRYPLTIESVSLLISMFHRAFFNSIIGEYQHMHFFTFCTILV